MPDKVRPTHRQRQAMIYIRQSTLSQVRIHHESTERQYALRERALEMGWPAQAITVIDEDLGISGKSADGRTGFQSLVASVSLGEVGAIFGLEVSRLARSSADWHRLLELCALFDTLIVDADGIYDLADFNDRLVLGLKGTMSEAELHLLRGRLLGGKINKAKKGELHAPLPVGYVFDAAGRIVLDPDEQVQTAVRTLFDAFRRTGTAFGTVQYFVRAGLKFPKRAYGGVWNGQLLWGPLGHGRVLGALKNPVYAGTYVFGRYHYQPRLTPEGRLRLHQVAVPPDQWLVRIDGHHPGYVTLEEFELNQTRLAKNRTNAVVSGAAREGMALLQGLLICGSCGRRLTVRYVSNKSGGVWHEYECNHSRRDGVPGPHCSTVRGSVLDFAVITHVLAQVSVDQFEVALRAVQTLDQEREAQIKSYRLRLDRAKYEAGLAERQFELVDPENRLVARTLEQRWNERLGDVEAANKEYQAFQRHQAQTLPAVTREQVLAVAEDLPRLWGAPTTSFKDKKRLLRLLLSDVTVTGVPHSRMLSLGVRWTGGRHELIAARRPPRASDARRCPPETRDAVAALAPDHSNAQIADLLNARKMTAPSGNPFTHKSIAWIRRRYGLPKASPAARATPAPRPEPADGAFSVAQAARHFGVSHHVIYYWIERGYLQATKLDRGWPWRLRLDAADEQTLRNRVEHSGHLHRVGLQIPSPH